MGWHLMGCPLVAEEAGKEKADFGDEGDEEEGCDHGDKQGQERPDHAGDTGSCDPAPDEQHTPDRRRAQPYT